MTILATRTALKNSLSGVTANVYNSVPETPFLPFVVIVPSQPYMEPNIIGKSTTHVKLNFVLSCGVSNADNESALDNLEQLTLSVLAAIPSGYEISTVSQPAPATVGNGSRILVSEIEISTQYTN